MTALLFWIVMLGLARRIYRNRQPKSPPLCTDCVFAHMQYALDGRRAISCTYGGGVRPIAIDVLYCTDFCNRNVPRRPPKIGFAPAPAPVPELAEVARG